MHETLGKFTKVKYKLDLVLSNQRYSFNKNDLGYKPNRSFKNICNDRKKSNHPIFKFNFCNKLDHLKPYFYAKLNDLRWYKENNLRPLRTINAPGPKKIQVPKLKS